LTTLTITGPVSPNIFACARIFSSIAALPTSPFNAAMTWRLIANSNLDVVLVRPFSSPARAFRGEQGRAAAEKGVEDDVVEIG
jgi:hypothetical protein